MGIDNLHRTISQAIGTPGSELRINTGLLNSSSINELLNEYNIGALILFDARVNPVVANSFTVTTTEVLVKHSEAGGISVLAPLGTYTPTCTFSFENGEAQLTLSFDINPGSALGDLIGVYEGTTASNLDISYTSLILTTIPQALSNGPQDTKAGLILKGNLDLTGSMFSPISTIFSENSIDVGLLVTQEPEQPISIELYSDKLSQFSIESLELKDPQISITDTQPFAGKILEIKLLSALTISGSINSLNTVGIYPILNQEMVNISGSFSEPVSINSGLSELANLFSTSYSSLTGVLPSSLTDIGSALSLCSAETTFSIPDLSLFMAQATIRAKKSFCLFPNNSILNIDSLDFTWYIFNPFVDTNPPINFYAKANVEIDSKYQVDICLSEDNGNYYVRVNSAPGQTLGFTDLLTYFHVPTSSFPKLTVSDFEFFAADFSGADFEFAINCEDAWQPISSLSKLSLEDANFFYSYTSSASSVAAGATWKLSDDVSFQVEAVKANSSWSFDGYIDSVDGVSIATIISAIESFFSASSTQSLPSFLEDTLISQANISFTDTSSTDISFSLSAELDVLGQSLPFNMQVSVDAKTKTYSFAASVYFLGEEFTIDVASLDSNSSFFSASWSSTTNYLSINDVLGQLGLSALDIPAGINYDLELNSIAFTYYFLSGHEKVSLQVTNQNSLTAYLETQSSGSSYDYCFAVDLSGISLSSLSSDLGFFDAISLDYLALVVSKFTSNTYTIPITGTPYTGVSKGVSIRAQMTMQASPSAPSGPLTDVLGYLESTFSGTTIAIGINLNQAHYTLIGSTNADIDFPSATKDIFSLQNPGILIRPEPSFKFALRCETILDFDFDSSPPVNSLDFEGSIFFSESDSNTVIGASLSETQAIDQLFGLPVNLSNLSACLNGSIGETDDVEFGLGGTFKIGSGNSVQGKLSADIEDIDDVINIPYFNGSISNLDFKAIFNAILPGTNLPNLFDFNFQNIEFYFCDQTTTTSSGRTVLPGISFLAKSTIWNYSSYINFSADIKEAKITGNIDLNPISISVEGVNLASITGKGKANSKYGISAGGPAVNFDSSALSLSASVAGSVLGVDLASAEASFSTQGLKVKSFYESTTGSITIDSNFSSIDSFSFSFSDSFYFDNIALVDDLASLGSITNLSASFTAACSLNGSLINIDLSGNLDWSGQNIDLNTTGLSPISINVSDLDEGDYFGSFLAILKNTFFSSLEADVNSIFRQFLDDPEEYMSALLDGALTDGDFVVNVLYHHFNVTNVVDLLQDVTELVNRNYHVDGILDINLNESITIPSETFKIGFTVPFVNQYIDKPFETPEESLTIVDIDAQKHLDLSSSLCPINESFSTGNLGQHADIFHCGGTLGFNGSLDVKGTIDLGDLEQLDNLNLTISGSASINVHGDIYVDHSIFHYHIINHSYKTSKQVSIPPITL